MFTAFSAHALISTEPLYIFIPPFLQIDLLTIFDDVSFHICNILAPTSCTWPLPAYATHKWSAFALSHFKTLIGYNIVFALPKFPHIHSIYPFSSTNAFLVFRL